MRKRNGIRIVAHPLHHCCGLRRATNTKHSYTYENRHGHTGCPVIPLWKTCPQKLVRRVTSQQKMGEDSVRVRADTQGKVCAKREKHAERKMEQGLLCMVATATVT